MPYRAGVLVPAVRWRCFSHLIRRRGGVWPRTAYAVSVMAFLITYVTIRIASSRSMSPTAVHQADHDGLDAVTEGVEHPVAQAGEHAADRGEQDREQQRQYWQRLGRLVFRPQVQTDPQTDADHDGCRECDAEQQLGAGGRGAGDQLAALVQQRAEQPAADAEAGDQGEPADQLRGLLALPEHET